MKKIFLFAMPTVLLISSCKKNDDTVVKPAETSPVVKTFFQNVPVTIAATGSGNYEYGIRFSVTQNGKVTKLGTRMPDAGTYRVTLWDASVTPKTVVASASVTQAAGVLTYQSLPTAASLTTGKDYLISIWSSGRWYEIRPTTASTFTYPLNIGSISIKGYQWIGTPSTPQTFPTNSETTYVAGMPDMEYQPD